METLDTPTHPHTYPPELYAATHCGNPGDTAFYAEVCRGGKRVLELGCGAGRLIRPLVTAGASYVGVDTHTGLLALARAAITELPAGHSPAEALEMDMRVLELRGDFDRILLPFSGLYCLADRASVGRCFARVAALLSENGLFILDAYNADSFHRECTPADQSDEHEDHIAQVEALGRGWDVYERSSWSKAEQRLVAHYRYSAADLERHGSIAHHYLLNEQLIELLREHGLLVEHRFGDFERGPWHADGDHTVLIVRRARGAESPS